MEKLLFPVPEQWANTAHCDNATYLKLYERSVNDPEGFWAEQSRRIDWFKPWTRVKEGSFDKEVQIKWFVDGKLNVSYNCLDRHLEKRGDQVAIIWESDDPAKSRKHHLPRTVRGCPARFANVLKSLGLRKGDRATIYLPMIPELAIAMLACTSIGVIHSIVFAGFSPESLAGRIQDCKGKIVITADEGLRGGKSVPLKLNTDEAVQKCPEVEKSGGCETYGRGCSMGAGPRRRVVGSHEIGLHLLPPRGDGF